MNAAKALITVDDIVGLDAGVRGYVAGLMEHGIETFESCEGGAGHCMFEPTVLFHGGQEQGYKAFSVAVMLGYPVWQLSRYYSVTDNQLEGPWWSLTFRRKFTAD